MCTLRKVRTKSIGSKKKGRREQREDGGVEGKSKIKIHKIKFGRKESKSSDNRWRGKYSTVQYMQPSLGAGCGSELICVNDHTLGVWSR